MDAELPLFLHLVGLALWSGGALSGFFMALALRGERDWKKRLSLVGLGRRMSRAATFPGVLLSLGSGVWLIFSFKEWPPPIYLYVKIGVAALCLVGTITSALSLGKALESAQSCLAAPSSDHEDRFDSMIHGYGGGLTFVLAGLLVIVALAAVRPNW